VGVLVGVECVEFEACGEVAAGCLSSVEPFSGERQESAIMAASYGLLHWRVLDYNARFVRALPDLARRESDRK